VIVKTGKDFTKEENEYATGNLDFLPAMYCEKCKSKS